MGYIAVGEIKDDKASKKTKLKMACLAHVMSYNFASGKKINEYKQLQSFVASHIKKLEASEFSENGAIVLKNSSIEHMQTTINTADERIQEITDRVALNQLLEDHLHRSIVNDGFYELKNRAFTVANTGRYVEFFKKGDTKENPWVSDNKKLANQFVEDFKAALPPGIPRDAFSFRLLPDCGNLSKKSDALVVAFSHVLEYAVKAALLKVTNLNLTRMGQDDYPENLRVDFDTSETHALKYEDVRHVAYCMPYLVETEGSRESAGELTIEMLRSADPLSRLREIPLQQQFPLMKIEQYAEIDGALKGFIEDSFGGSIGRSEDGYRRAMMICMGHYEEEQAKEFNIEKELERWAERIVSIKDEETPSNAM